MIAEVDIPIGTVTFRLSLPLKRENIEKVREEMRDFISAAYDKAVTDLRAEIKKRKAKK